MPHNTKVWVTTTLKLTKSLIKATKGQNCEKLQARKCSNLRSLITITGFFIHIYHNYHVLWIFIYFFLGNVKLKLNCNIIIVKFGNREVWRSSSILLYCPDTFHIMETKPQTYLVIRPVPCVINLVNRVW